MASTITSTPLRKSDASRHFSTPQSVIRGEVDNQTVNDDEAERRSLRSVSTLNDTATSLKESDNIKLCLKLYSDNKMSKDNAWSLTIIDSFATLMSRHSRALQSFQVAGSTLEASTKVYGLRVDSVHTDVMRMCSELTRQTAQAMNSNPADQDEDDGAAGSNQSIAEGGGDKENTVNTSANAQQAKAKKKRTRKMVSTVTKSKDSINAPLETIPFMDPFFAKLNSVVGDVNSSSRLMQNIVPTRNAELRLNMDYPFWDPSESPELELDAVPAKPIDPSECCTIRFFPLGPDNLLRTLRSGYMITDAPAEADEEEEEEGAVGDGGGNRTQLDAHMDDVDAREHGLSLMNRSALDVHFDINAEVEPIPSGDAFILDYDAQGNVGNDDFAEDDEMALEQCKGLMRKTVLIEDMRPLETTSSQLEYSYRPLENISQFWAGPAHWKFKRSMRPRTMAPSDASSTASGTNVRESVVRRKKRFELETLDDVLSVNEDLFREYNPNRPIKRITYLKSSVCKKWESKRLKLPTDYKLDKNRLEVYLYGRGISVTEHGASDGHASGHHALSEGYSCDGGDDQISCSNDTNDGGDNDNDMMHHDEGTFRSHEQQNGPHEPNEREKSMSNSMVVDAISNEYQGAPDKVHKIHIAYAKTAKVIDMKQLKYSCWRVISSYLQADPGPPPSQPSASQPEDVMLPPPTQPGDANVTFTTIYRKVPQLLSKTMSENISRSLAFYGVLHLANEKALLLGRQEDLKDFTIRKAHEVEA